LLDISQSLAFACFHLQFCLALGQRLGSCLPARFEFFLRACEGLFRFFERNWISTQFRDDIFRRLQLLISQATIGPCLVEVSRYARKSFLALPKLALHFSDPGLVILLQLQVSGEFRVQVLQLNRKGGGAFFDARALGALGLEAGRRTRASLLTLAKLSLQISNSVLILLLDLLVNG